MSMIAGMTVLPERLTRIAPAGTRTLAALPTCVMRAPLTMNDAFSSGARPSPVMMRPPSNTVTVDAGVCAGAVTDHTAAIRTIDRTDDEILRMRAPLRSATVSNRVVSLFASAILSSDRAGGLADDVPESTVVVVGGGASGLSAAAALARRGIQAVVLEQDREIGGTWARRYERLHLHTVRGFSGLAHFPIPRRYPTYLSRDDFVAYLKEYADHFKLHVVTAATVQKIRSRRGSPAGWIVETAHEQWNARVVVIAT